MNWRNERIPKMNKTEQVKNFIKNELVNYYFYLECFNKYHEQFKRISDLQDDPPIGGSMAKIPEGTVSKSSQQERISFNKASAESNMRYYENKLDTLDSWMNILTESQHNVVKCYVMEYQCKNIHEAALELKYEEDTVNKYTRRAINRIHSKIRNFT